MDKDIEQLAWDIYYNGAIDALEAVVRSLKKTQETFGDISIPLSTLIETVNKSKTIYVNAPSHLPEDTP